MSLPDNQRTMALATVCTSGLSSIHADIHNNNYIVLLSTAMSRYASMYPFDNSKSTMLAADTVAAPIAASEAFHITSICFLSRTGPLRLRAALQLQPPTRSAIACARNWNFRPTFRRSKDTVKMGAAGVAKGVEFATSMLGSGTELDDALRGLYGAAQTIAKREKLLNPVQVVVRNLRGAPMVRANRGLVSNTDLADSNYVAALEHTLQSQRRENTVS